MIKRKVTVLSILFVVSSLPLLSINSQVETTRRLRGIVQPAVQTDFRELVNDLRKIESPYFVFDVDKTLLPKDVDLSKPAGKHRYLWTLETLYSALKNAKEKNTLVAIISANSRAYVGTRLIEPLKVYLKEKGELDLMAYLIFYADGGGYRMLFGQVGSVEEERAVVVDGINAEGISTQEMIENIQEQFQVIIKDKRQLKNLLNNMSKEEYRKNYKELLIKKYGFEEDFAEQVVSNSTWIEGDENFQLPVIHLEAGEITQELLEELGNNVAAPWIEVRDGVQLAIKPFLEFEKGSAEKREILMKLLRKLDLNIVPGGSTTIDISLIKKSQTLKDFINLVRNFGKEINNEQIVYFGDEFRQKIKGYDGHDMSIAKEAKDGGDLEGIVVVSVDENKPHPDIQDVVRWIGNGPGQTLDIINNLLRDKTNWQNIEKIREYLKNNARSILLNNSGVINLSELSKSTYLSVSVSELKGILSSKTFSGNFYYRYPGAIALEMGRLLSKDNLEKDTELKKLLLDKIEEALRKQGVDPAQLRHKVVEVYDKKLEKNKFVEFEFFDTLTEQEALQNLTFEILDRVVENEEIKYATMVHLDGDWHINAHVMLVDKKGNMLVQVKKIEDGQERRLDLSASGHISAGEKITDGAVREMEEEIVGLPIIKNRLRKVGIYKKISGNEFSEKGYQGTVTRGVFQGSSSEVYNREISGFFVYIVDELRVENDQVIAFIDGEKYQLAPGESKKLIIDSLDNLLNQYNNLKGQSGIEIDDYFRSAFRQYFEIPGLIGYIKKILQNEKN